MPTIIIENLDEINKAIARSGPLVYKAAKQGLLEAAEPVRQDAGRLSQTQISGMKRAKRTPPPWSVQKKGSTVHEVYIVPSQRGVRHADDPKSRPLFALLMLEKAYDPALERNEMLVRNTVDGWLSRVVREV